MKPCRQSYALFAQQSNEYNTMAGVARVLARKARCRTLGIADNRQPCFQRRRQRRQSITNTRFSYLIDCYAFLLYFQTLFKPIASIIINCKAWHFIVSNSFIINDTLISI